MEIIFSHAGHFPKKSGVENGTHPIHFPLSPKVFYPEYPENPNSLGEAIRKARTDKGLMINELGELVRANEMTVINQKLRTGA